MKRRKERKKSKTENQWGQTEKTNAAECLEDCNIIKELQYSCLEWMMEAAMMLAVWRLYKEESSEACKCENSRI